MKLFDCASQRFESNEDQTERKLWWQKSACLDHCKENACGGLCTGSDVKSRTDGLRSLQSVLDRPQWHRLAPFPKLWGFRRHWFSDRRTKIANLTRGRPRVQRTISSIFPCWLTSWLGSESRWSLGQQPWAWCTRFRPCHPSWSILVRDFAGSSFAKYGGKTTKIRVARIPTPRGNAVPKSPRHFEKKPKLKWGWLLGKFLEEFERQHRNAAIRRICSGIFVADIPFFWQNRNRKAKG